MSADGLHETGRCRGELDGPADIVERNSSKGGLPEADRNSGGAHQASALVARVDDVAVDDLDPSDELIGEAKPVGGAERLEILDHVGGRIVVVGEPRPEDRLVQPGDRLGRDPAEAHGTR